MSSGRAVGTYALVLHLSTAVEIQIGRLGRFAFPAGFYVYSGSALGGLEARLARHWREEKRLHWHIDYLRQHAEAVKAYTLAGKGRRECEVARIVRETSGAIMPAPRFGASDCRCPSHLVWLPEEPNLAGLVEDLRPCDAV